MALDAWSNTGLSSLASGIDASQTTLTVLAGTGSRFPSANFQLVIWNVTDFANPIDAADREIVRCTSRTGDVLTIVRGQEGTTGVAHNTAGKTYSVALAITKRFRDSIFQKINIVVFTASGTYTKPSNLIAARVIVVGGGGGGGGSGGAVGDQGGAGGGSGSYSESILPVSSIGATEMVTIGAAGAAGSGTGGTGGDSSFGALVIAKGGTGGEGGVTLRAAGGDGGIIGTGQIKIPGSAGQDSSLPAAGDVILGGGGAGVLGGGIRTRILAQANTTGLDAAANTSSGGGGGFNGLGGGGGVNGGAGGSGIVIIYEYLNEL